MRTLFHVFIALIVAIGLSNTVGGLVRLHDNGTFGFQMEQVRGEPAKAIARAVRSGSPAGRADIRDGDLLTIEPTFSMMVVSRIPVPGDTLRLADGNRSISLLAETDQSPAPLALISVLTSSKLAFLLIALLIAIRRSDDASARALAVFLACFGCAIDFDQALLPQLWARFATFALLQLLFLIGPAAALRFACLFPEQPSEGIRVLLARAVAPLLAAGIALSLASFYFLFVQPSPGGFHISALSIAYTILLLILIAGTLLALIDSYRRSSGVQRARMRWVVGTFLVGFSGLLALFVSLIFGARDQVFQYLALTITAIPFGLGYVILRHRVIDMGFVVNRAVVYTTVSLVVVGAFIVFEWLLSHVVEANSRASSLIELSGALALGLSIRVIHARVDRYVDDLFFRERHEAEAAIRRFAHEAALITDSTDLVRKTVDVAQRNASLEGAAFYALDNGVFASAFSTLPCAPDVGENDYAVLEMRTWHKPVDLAGRETAVPGEIAFPMVVRGTLAGFLACGAKISSESPAPDELDALAVLAHDCGIALDSLRITTVERELAQTRLQLAAFVAPSGAQL